MRVSRCSTDHTIEYTAPDEAATVRGFAVDPSAQRLNTQRESGPPCGDDGLIVQFVPVVQASATGAVYVPTGHPAPDTVNGSAVLLLIVTAVAEAEKFAVTDLGPSMTRASGFEAPLATRSNP